MGALYEIGEFVEMVDLAQFGPRQVPIPQRWFVLRIHPAREFKVMRIFAERNISAYLPQLVRTIGRDTGKVVRKPHLGRKVTEPLFPGVMFVPDFECDNAAMRSVDGVAGLLQFGPYCPFLTPAMLNQVRAIEAISTIGIAERRRRFKLGELVRIVDGPFVGFEGRIDRLDSKGRLRVLIDALKRGAKVSITEAQIEPVLAATAALDGWTAARDKLQRDRPSRP